MNRPFSITAVLLLLVAVTSPSINAQLNPNIENGVKPYGAYDSSDFDTISVANGNLFLHIPLTSYPQRGSLTSKTVIISNGKNFTVAQTCNPHLGTCTSRWYWGDPSVPSPGPGVSVVSTNFLWMHNHFVSPNNWETVYTWDGSSHQMAHLANGTQAPFDGSGYSLNASLGILDGHGNFPGAEDTNGNFFGGTPVADTMGRTSSSSTTTDYTGCNGPLPTTSAVIGVSPGYGAGGTLQTKFCYANGTVNTSFNAYNWDPYGNRDFIQELQATEQFLQTVIVYDGNSWATSPKWSFTFDAGVPPDASTHYGDLLSVTLPTGGTISYTFASGTFCGTRPALIPKSRVVTSRAINANDGTGPHTTTYNGSVVTDPMGNDAVHTITGLGGSCSYYDTEVDYYQGSHTSGTLLKKVLTTYQYQQNPFDVIGDGSTSTATAVFPTQITTVWANGQQSQVQMTYDANLAAYAPFGSVGGSTQSYTMSYGKLMEKREYDYGTSPPLPLLRKTDYTYRAFDNSAYMTANMLDLTDSAVVYNGSGTQVAQTTYGYDEYGVQTTSTPQHGAAPNSVRGNETSVKRWLNTTGGTLNTTTTYFDTGMPYQVTDPKGNITTYAYSSTFDGAYLTQTTMPLTGSVQHIVSAGYDFNTGRMTSFTDQNNQPFSYQYDSLWRPISGNYPDGGQSTIQYPDLQTIQMQKKIDASRNTNKYLHFDGLARPIRTITANGESTPWDQVDTCYNADGEKGFVSYPYQGNGLADPAICSGAGDSFVYDGLGRTTTVTHSDGTSVITSYFDASNHTGRATSVQDEGNGTQRVQRISQVDGLGRLASVCEVSGNLTVGITGSQSATACGQDIGGTGFLTTYTYDALDNLTSVAQGPLNARTFAYDSLSRLTSALNPETGTVPVAYTYDADSNVLTKNDARNITITYAYDQLNRLTGKTYSDSTPAATYNYDQNSALGVTLTNTIGRKSSEITASPNATGSVFSYDPMGRVIKNSQCTPQNCSGTPFSIVYTYDLLGDSLTSTNGAGVTLTSAYNIGAGLTTLTSSLSDSNHPGTLLSGLHYNAGGAVVAAALGNGVNEARTYDARLRLSSITDGSLYSLSIPTTGGYAPNGGILATNDSVNGNWTYTYDPFNRLFGSNQNTGTTTYSYAYDRFGNRWQQNVTHGTGTPSSLGFDAYNRITASFGVTYDAAGNTTSDGTTAYTYDAEGRVTAAVNGLSGASTYIYDAEGRRIRKVTVAGGTADFVYDLGDHEISQFGSTGSWNRGEVYAIGRHVATYANSTTYFIHADWLATERARSTVAGAPYETCTSLPYGDALSCSGPDVSPLHFTGKEHDTETGLENFGARYDSSSSGRFMTPDWSAKPIAVPYAEFGDPQSLDLYVYVRDNPASHADVDGHCWPVCDLVAKLSGWASEGIATQGGKQFSQNVGIGALKGAGTFALNTGKTVVAAAQTVTGNPIGAVGTVMKSGPQALEPSNQTQAQVSTATQITLTVASVAVPALGEAEAASATTIAGETFTHYGFLADADSFTAGLRPGSFASTESGLTGSEAQSGLALPHASVPDAAYPVTPEPGTPINGPTPAQPANGQPGGLPEVSFPQGTGPGTVGPPRPIPPCSGVPPCGG